MTTLAAVKEALRLVGSSDDIYLQALIDRASAAISRHCGRNLFRQRYQETLPGYGGFQLQLAHTPIRSVTSVTLRGDAITDYVVEDADAGWLYRERAWEWTRTVNWSLSERIVSGGELPLFTVAYEAGYLFAASASSDGRTLPVDLEQAAIETARAWYLARARDPAIAARRVGPLSVDYRGADETGAPEALPPSARALARPYRRAAVLV